MSAIKNVSDLFSDYELKLIGNNANATKMLSELPISVEIDEKRRKLIDEYKLRENSASTDQLF